MIKPQDAEQSFNHLNNVCYKQNQDNLCEWNVLTSEVLADCFIKM